MNQLIPINPRTINNQAVNTVNARNLHTFLEVGKDFSTWIKDRIEQFGFSEGADFVKFPEIGESTIKMKMEYALTIDMAKELSMVERNTKGKEARQYFIECEKLAKQSTLIDPKVQLANAVLVAQQVIQEMQAEKEQLLLENTKQQEKILQDRPKVDYVNDLIETDEKLSVRNVAKSLHLKETEFRNWLVWAGELLDAGKHTANRYSISADAARNRHMDLKRSKPRTTEDGEVFQAITPYFTDLGVLHIKTRLKRYKEKYPEKYAVSFKDSIADARKAQVKEAKLQEFSVI